MTRHEAAPASGPAPALLRALDRAVEWLLGAVLAALLLIGTAQIVARFFFSFALSWSLEASVLLLVWATMLSGYIGVRRDVHLSADFVGLAMAPRTRWRLQAAGLVLCLVFVAVYGSASFAIIDAMDGIPFTALPFGQPVLYWSLPTSAVLMALALVVRLNRHLRTPPAATPARD